MQLDKEAQQSEVKANVKCLLEREVFVGEDLGHTCVCDCVYDKCVIYGPGVMNTWMLSNMGS